ncbi:MAG TPA: diguanylate cyclase response regulator [Nitrospiraceae bacterium]|jgi:diguanylate cyclase (GGDEF)-like protein|nr:diguanylate cyclase response regulator [Nitrospiraceae bacterium]
MKTIIVISRHINLNKEVIGILKGIYNLVQLEDINRLFDVCFTEPPDLILLDTNVLNTRLSAAISNLKSDPLFAHLPILIVIDTVDQIKGISLRSIIDDYLIAPFDIHDLTFRMDLCTLRAQKILETNPLTRLPGNITIIKEIQRRIDTDSLFSFAYADLDHFKPFNDRYGFSRGDEVIRMTARLISNIIKIKGPEESFVGHIGGDDFVFIITGVENIDTVCSELCANFDEIIQSFYDPEERAKAFIEALDRDGKRRTFPLLTLSIGIAHNKHKGFSHYGQVSEIASEMKKHAKTFTGSRYMIDRRTK